VIRTVQDVVLTWSDFPRHTQSLGQSNCNDILKLVQFIIPASSGHNILVPKQATMRLSLGETAKNDQT
jgi:hypothetical protein